MEKFLVSASTGAMCSVLGKLGKMLSEEYKLLKGVRDDIKFLKDELEAMQVFLIMMAEQEQPDQQAKLRADAVREMSYEIEDNIDKFMVLLDRDTSSESDGFGKLFVKSMKKITDIKTRHKIAKDVKDIKSQVKEINERYARYKIDESSKARDAKIDPRVLAVYKNPAELVGIGGPRDELMKWLSNKEGESAHTHHKIVSIVGYGGLGKTTLAKQIYDKSGANFECRAFVSISRSPDMRKILSSLLSEISNGREHAREGAQQIIDQIREVLRQKRYFIVIDDVWDVQTWHVLDCALIRNGCGSVIMSTTRIYDVAKSCCSSHGDLVYKMQPLGDVDSKMLFFKRIFGCEEKCPPNLKEASECIIKRCGGLPLAINAICSLLATGKPKEEWERVGHSIGFAQGKSSEIDAMSYVLSLSYFDLPLHLRSCLLYLSMFSEDSSIEREDLIYKWISEGFVHGEDGDDLAELGYSYFCELVNRSLIEPSEMDYDGKAWNCQVHDTILDFLICKSTEENFCIRLSNHSKPGRRIIRRLSVGDQEYEGQESFEQLDLSHARSLIYSGDSAEQLSSFMKSKALRVLDLKGIRLENHQVRDVGKLLQLRYLNICNTDISELPRQIGDLVYLETLDLVWTKLDELPESISRLKRLARLFVDKRTKFPGRIGSMQNLQELRTINPLKQSLDFVEELGKLTNLRKLSISWDTDGDEDESSKAQKLVASLCNLDRCKLHTLSIGFPLTEKFAALGEHSSLSALSSVRAITVDRGQLSEITKWMVSLVNLKRLRILRVEMGQKDLEMVGSISTLLYLELGNIRNAGYFVSSAGFQQLHTLRMNLTVRWLKFEAGAMPKLKELEIFIHLEDKRKSSDRGGTDDFGIQHLSNLDLVSVWFWRKTDVQEADSVAAQESEMVDFRRMVGAHPNRPTLKCNGR